MDHRPEVSCGLVTDKWFGHNLKKGSIIFSKCEIVANSVILLLVIILLICGDSILTVDNFLHDYFRVYVSVLVVFRAIVLFSSIRLHKGANNDIKKYFWPYFIVEIINFPVNLYIFMFLIYCSVLIAWTFFIGVSFFIVCTAWNFYGYFRVLKYYKQIDVDIGNGSGEPDNVQSDAFRPTYPIPITTTVLMTSETSDQNYEKNGITTKN